MMDRRQHLALLDQGPRHLDSDGPTPFAGADLRSLVRKLTGGDSWIAWWSSWLLGSRIEVSRMSDTWLRTHADDWDKHEGDR